MAAVDATRRPPPRPDRAAAVGPRLLIRQSRSPAYFAASPHIWRPSHYPPPADAVGSSYSSAPVNTDTTSLRDVITATDSSYDYSINTGTTSLRDVITATDSYDYSINTSTTSLREQQDVYGYRCTSCE